jgi:TAG lipase / lysophosphatidylethanolamine acyltransferase
VKALHEQSILPSIINGQSMGALVAAIICSRTPNQLDAFLLGDTAAQINYASFDRVPKEGSLRRKLRRFLTEGHFFDVRVLEAFVFDNLGNMTFEEAYRLSGRVLNISVTPQRKHEVPTLLNYLTAPDIVIWSAACASCSVPGLYDSVLLRRKTSSGTIVPWTPGDVRIQWGSSNSENYYGNLIHLFNVNHFIISQIVPYHFRILETLFPPLPVPSTAPLVTRIFGALRSEVHHRLYQLDQIGFLPRVLRRYVRIPPRTFYERLGEDVGGGPSELVLILSPPIDWSDFVSIFSNPTPHFLREGIQKGYQYVFPFLPKLLVRMKVEMALERILQSLKTISPELAPLYENLVSEGGGSLSTSMTLGATGLAFGSNATLGSVAALAGSKTPLYDPVFEGRPDFTVGLKYETGSEEDLYAVTPPRHRRTVSLD